MLTAGFETDCGIATGTIELSGYPHCLLCLQYLQIYYTNKFKRWCLNVFTFETPSFTIMFY